RGVGRADRGGRRAPVLRRHGRRGRRREPAHAPGARRHRRPRAGPPTRRPRRAAGRTALAGGPDRRPDAVSGAFLLYWLVLPVLPVIPVLPATCRDQYCFS